MERKVQLSGRAVMARINRALKKDGEVLRCCRERSRDRHNMGSHYVVDTTINGVVNTHVDVETLGRDLGVIKPWEELADDE